MALKQGWIYLRERSPLPALSILAAGLVLSGQGFAGRHDGLLGTLGFGAILLLLIFMRIADELKDFDKDKIIHPERPLPRGLVTRSQLQWGLNAIIALVLVIACAGALPGDALGSVLLLGALIFAWGMYHEFFVGKRLSAFPMAYALSHQAIVFPLYAFATAWLIGDGVFGPVYVYYLIANFGASMAFEICRKLDPRAHPRQETYLRAYGPAKTALIIALFVALSAFAAAKAGLGILLWPLEAALLAVLPLIVYRPEQFKRLEGLSLLHALVAIWSLALLGWFR